MAPVRELEDSRPTYFNISRLGKVFNEAKNPKYNICVVNNVFIFHYFMANIF